METLNFKNSNPGAVQFGNFINYYQFHPPENRISLLPKDIWNISSVTKKSFSILDVGCNAGDLTLALHTFFTKSIGLTECSILGIDMDPTLIRRACEQNKTENCTFKCVDIMSDSRYKDVILDYLSLHSCNKFNIVFCFSITMWIHLNHGDDGLKIFLRRVSELSSFLVIEPQPWKCYRRAVKRLKPSGSVFPMFKGLTMRQNIEEEIENFITEHCGLVKIKESVRTEWDRKLLIFKRIEK